MTACQLTPETKQVAFRCHALDQERRESMPAMAWHGCQEPGPGGEGSLCFVKWDLFCQSTIQRSYFKPTSGYLGVLLRQGRRGRTWITGPYEKVSPTYIHIQCCYHSQSDYCNAQLAIQETTASLQLQEVTEASGHLKYHGG